jgi:hypothetical protein
MVLETYGYMGPDFIAFLRRLAAAAADNVDMCWGRARHATTNVIRHPCGRRGARWLDGR